MAAEEPEVTVDLLLEESLDDADPEFGPYTILVRLPGEVVPTRVILVAIPEEGAYVLIGATFFARWSL